MSLLVFLLGIFYLVSHVNGYGRHASWINAHATFYGGSDASGTMGMYACLHKCNWHPNYVNLNLNGFGFAAVTNSRIHSVSILVVVRTRSNNAKKQTKIDFVFKIVSIYTALKSLNATTITVVLTAWMCKICDYNKSKFHLNYIGTSETNLYVSHNFAIRFFICLITFL
jgi:hypothetical protein